MIPRITYHGEIWTLHMLQKRLGLGFTLLQRWHREGRLSEATVDEYIARRAERWLLQEKAESNGISIQQLRERLRLKWDPEKAATLPILGRWGHAHERPAKAAS